MPVAISVALTAALGTTPPDGSVTVPLIEPRKVWAFAATASENAIKITTTRRFIKFISPLRDQEVNSAARPPARAGRRLKDKARPLNRPRLKTLAHLSD